MQISVHPHFFGGKTHGASTLLRSISNGAASPAAIAPVLLLESVE
jgi:hypothetical protein